MGVFPAHYPPFLKMYALPTCTKWPWTSGPLTKPEWSFIPNQIKLIFSQEIFFKAKKFALKLGWSFKRKGCQLRTVFGPPFPILCEGKERDPVGREEWRRQSLKMHRWDRQQVLPCSSRLNSFWFRKPNIFAALEFLATSPHCFFLKLAWDGFRYLQPNSWDIQIKSLSHICPLKCQLCYDANILLPRTLFFLYHSGFCRTLTWISHGFICVPHPDPRTLLNLSCRLTYLCGYIVHLFMTHEN